MAVVVGSLGCAPRGTPEASPTQSVSPSAMPSATPSAVDAPAGSATPAACCKDQDELKRLSGQRVTITGIYHPVFVQKRVGPLPDHDSQGRPAQTVSIETESKIGIMLEIYHSARGKRPAEEIQQFSGKEVRVTGTLHERTPSQSEDGVVMQTMIAPYIGEIERIEATGR